MRVVNVLIFAKSQEPRATVFSLFSDVDVHRVF